MRHGGTHLITPIVRRFTDRPVYSPKGIASLNCIPSEIVIVFTRDPRNRAISNLRYKLGREAVPGLNASDRDTLLAAFLASRKNDGALTVIDFMHRWAKRWRSGDQWRSGDHAYTGRASTLVRFEDLVGENSLAWTATIGQFLERAGAKLVATPNEARAYALGKSGTWTGSHSNYADWFGPKSCDFWRRNFGLQCTIEMGYTIDGELGI